MDSPSVCKFAYSIHNVLNNELINAIAQTHSIEFQEVNKLNITLFESVMVDDIKEKCKGPSSILTIKLLDNEGTPEERLSKLMDNTQGCMNLIGMKSHLDVGLIIFHGEVPPAIWTNVKRSV